MSTARPDERLVLPNLVRALAAEQPDAIFLQEVGGRALTYAEVYEAARGLAASLRRRGIQSGDRVATFFPTGADGVVIWLACAYAAAINVPISTGYVGHMLEHAIDLTKPVLILADAQLVEPLAEQSVRAGTLGELREGQRPADDDPAPAAWTGCPSLMFTSGTTGPSKAVTMRWLQLYRMATNTCKTDFAAPGDRVYVPWPLNHISGTGSVYAAAISAGTAVLREKWSTSSFMADIYEHRCTFTLLMLEMTRYVMTMDLPEGLGECPLERVYAVPTNPDLAPLMAKLGARYCTSYNSTELSTLIVNPGMDAVPLGAAGKPRAGAQIRIVDADGDEVAPGEVGELLIRSQDPAEVFAGYWDMPEATQEAWRDGWFHTQDAVRIDENGWIYFLERMNDRIRHRGENVSPFDLETTLERHPHVLKCAAVGVPSEQYGEDDIVVFAVPAQEALTEAELREFCARELPKFMRPSRIVLVSELPETPTGKVQRAELRRRIQRAARDR